MTSRPARIVDCHVHFWDPARTDWYPYLSGGMKLDMGDTSGMNRRFDLSSYRAESPGWNVEKLVHVAAATGRSSIDETLEIDARDQVDAIIGGIAPTDTVEEALALLDRQASAPRFCGVRPMGQFEGPLPAPGVLAALEQRGLVFEVLSRPAALAVAAQGLAGFDGLTVVVEHAGWLSSAAEDEVRMWRTGMAALAALGEHVVCKLSGLAVPAGSMDADAVRPWIDEVIGWFGVDRCMFASNFPVDGLHGSLDELWSAYSEATAGLDGESRDKLFAANAERVYRV